MNNNVTYSKAVAIILMIIGHSACSLPYFTQTLYMFHMPLFFFMSGYCFKKKYLHEPGSFVYRRLKGIYWPYVKWSLIFLLLHNLFFYVHIYDVNVSFRGGDILPYTIPDTIYRAKNIIIRMDGHDQLLGGYWFMKALFYSSLISYFSFFIVDKMRLQRVTEFGKIATIGGIMFLIVFVFDQYHFTIPFIDLSSQPFYAALFFIIGHCFATCNVPRFKNWQICLALCLVFIGGFFWRMETGDQFYSNRKLIPSILTATLGTWSIYSLPWEKLKGQAVSVMQFIGKNTLTILTWHFLSFKLVSLLIISIYHIPITQLAEFPVIHSYAQTGWWIVYVVVSLFVCCMIAKTRNAFANWSVHHLIKN